MAKLALPEFVTSIANAFVQVVEQRVMQALAKGSEMFAQAASVLQNMTQATTPEPISVRTNLPLAPPNRGGHGR